MTSPALFKRAYELAIQLNQSAIIKDLVYMSDGELIGLVNFFISLQGARNGL